MLASTGKSRDEDTGSAGVYAASCGSRVSTGDSDGVLFLQRRCPVDDGGDGDRIRAGLAGGSGDGNIDEEALAVGRHVVGNADWIADQTEWRLQ